MNTGKKLTKEEIEKKVLRLSFIGSCLLSGSEIIMAFILRSYAVMMDGIFDSAELVMMGPFLVLVPLLYKPVNERHPYGYSQVESFFLIIKYSVLLITGGVLFLDHKVLSASDPDAASHQHERACHYERRQQGQSQHDRRI